MKNIILGDGAMGTELRARGVEVPSHTESIWSALALKNNSQEIIEVHKDYIDAGSDYITINNYAVTKPLLARKNLENEFKDLTGKAIDLAKEAILSKGSNTKIAASFPPLETSYRPDLVPSKKILQSEFNFKKLNALKKKFFNKNVNKIIISSVVPKCDFIFKEFLAANSLNFYFLKKIRKKIKLKINLKKKDEIGDDRIANIILAKERFNKSVIIVDFGTATTLDILNSHGVYHGGVITPGIEVSLNTLKNKTAKLPLVKFSRTKKVIGFIKLQIPW